MNIIEKALQKKQEQLKKAESLNATNQIKSNDNSIKPNSTALLDQLADEAISQEVLVSRNAKADDSTLNDELNIKSKNNRDLNKTHDNNQSDISPLNSTNREIETEPDLLNINSKIINIDLEYLETQGFLVGKNLGEVINEEYRQIKRPLIQNIRGKTAQKIDRANVIQVTSSLQGEGKTFTAINLALAFAAELDFNVLLVDADTIKSSITRTLLNNTKDLGLNDYLTGEIKDLSQVMLKTNIPKLSILPAGTRKQHSSELLNSEYMEKLIREFSERYENRVVVFDSPPLLQTNDARILSYRVGQLVFVVEQNKTEQTAINNALSLIDPEMVVGVVMNKSRNSGQVGYYGYYAPPE